MVAKRRSRGMEVRQVPAQRRENRRVRLCLIERAQFDVVTHELQAAAAEAPPQPESLAQQIVHDIPELSGGSKTRFAEFAESSRIL